MRQRKPELAVTLRCRLRIRLPSPGSKCECSSLPEPGEGSWDAEASATKFHFGRCAYLLCLNFSTHDHRRPTRTARDPVVSGNGMKLRPWRGDRAGRCGGGAGGREEHRTPRIERRSEQKRSMAEPRMRRPFRAWDRVVDGTHGVALGCRMILETANERAWTRIRL